MKNMARIKGWVAVLSIALAFAGYWSARAMAQAVHAAEPQKAPEQQFKNLQVLKNISPEQLIPTMQFISASLGVQCDFCHVEHEMQKRRQEGKEDRPKYDRDGAHHQQ